MEAGPGIERPKHVLGLWPILRDHPLVTEGPRVINLLPRDEGDWNVPAGLLTGAWDGREVSYPKEGKMCVSAQEVGRRRKANKRAAKSRRRNRK